MEMKQKGIWFRRHPVWTTLLGLLVLFASLGVIFSSGDSGIDYAETDIPYTELEVEYAYLGIIADYLDLYSDACSLDSDVLYATSDETMSITECSEYFERSTGIYKRMRQGLYSMDVPVKFKVMHQHIINSVMYVEEATNLIAQDCGNINLLNQATEKMYLARYEMDKVNNLLDKIN